MNDEKTYWHYLTTSTYIPFLLPVIDRSFILKRFASHAKFDEAKHDNQYKLLDPFTVVDDKGEVVYKVTDPELIVKITKAMLTE